MAHETLLSVIIPTYNRADLLGPALESILNQSISPWHYEIIVIDNNSSDGTKELVSAFNNQYGKHIEYVFEPEPGLMYGRHRGAQEANSNLLVFCDDDIIADENWLEAIVEAFDNPKVHLVGGKILPKYFTPPPDWVEQFWNTTSEGVYNEFLSLIDLGDQPKQISYEYVFGANYSIRKSSLIQCGGFHPDSFPRKLIHLRGDGETGLSRAIQDHGWLVFYEPKAFVQHQIPESRLTLNFFAWRSFIQGISDSYTRIRATNGSELPTSNEQQSSIHLISNLLINNELNVGFKSMEKLRESLRMYYALGWDYHQSLAKLDPVLLKYILQPTYLHGLKSSMSYTISHQDFPARLKEGLNLLQSGKLQDAQAIFLDILQRDDGVSQAHSLLGFSYYLQKDYDLARTEFSKTLAIDSEDKLAKDTLKKMDDVSPTTRNG